MTAPARPDRFWPWLAAIALAALLLRLFQLDYRSFWTDEFITLNVIRLPWGAIADNRLAAGHYPTYFYALKAWSLPFGDSHTALRLPSTLWNLAGGLLLALYLRPWAGNRAALLAALFYAVQQRSVWAALEARPYAAVITLVIAAHFALARLLAGGGWRWGLAYIAAAAAAVFHHMSVAPILLTHPLLLLLPNWRRARRARGPVLTASLVVLAALVLLALRRASGDSAGESEPWEYRFALRALAELFAGEYRYAFGSFFRYIICLLALWALWQAWAARRGEDFKRPELPLLLWWLASGFLVGNVLTALGHMGQNYRYLTPAMPAALALMAWALAAGLSPPRARLGLGLAFAAILLATQVGYWGYQGNRVDDAVRQINRNARPGDIVFSVSTPAYSQTFWQYYGPPRLPLVIVNRDRSDTDALREIWQRHTRDKQRAWVLIYKDKQTDFYDLVRELNDWKLVDEESVGKTRVALFSHAVPNTNPAD